MEALVSASLGPMGRLLRQLHSLHPRPPDEIQDLIELLERISISLKDLSEAEEPGLTAMCWMKEARELCYDTECLLDDSAAYAYQHGTDEHMNDVKAEYDILKARAGYAIERLDSYKIDPRSIRRIPFIDRLLAVVNADQICHGPIDVDLEKLLDIGKQEQLKIVSLVGPEGVGKTTLVKKLYNKLTGWFDCRAFLRVSPNPDIMMLLISLFIQIHKKQPSRGSNAQDLIENISEHLRDKRYLILLDDLWSESVWHIISRALPAGKHCSRIMTTTQIQNVALACCGYQSEYVLKMEPLNDIQSRKLFFNRAFGSEDLCPPDLREMSRGIIRKCGGLPLSTMNITSLFTSEPILSVEQLKLISDSLPSSLMGNPTSEGMKEVVKFVYNNLPPRLKTCLLYVSMYPSGYTIVMADLVKQWVAEEFVTDVRTGRDYFYELVTAGMIQPVDTDDTGKVLTCTVHHILLDLIAEKSMEENFIITLNYFHSTIALPEKVRRVSVQFSGARSANISASIIMSEVQSLFFFGFSHILPPIGDYKYLRVLALHIWAHQDKIFDLARFKVHELLRLRYMKIVSNIPVKLPYNIEQQKHLEILEVYATLVAIPLDIGELHNLRILNIAVRKLSSKDICFLQSLSALTALSLHVKIAPTENIVFAKGGFPVLEVFTFTCAPRLLIQAYAMPKLQKLKLCFSAHEAHQYGIIAIEYLPSLGEISAKIDGSSVETKHCFLSAIRNDPANPVVQLMEFREDKELGTLEEQYENMEEDSDGTSEIQNESSGVESKEDFHDKTYGIRNKGSVRSRKVMEQNPDETYGVQNTGLGDFEIMKEDSDGTYGFEEDDSKKEEHAEAVSVPETTELKKAHSIPRKTKKEYTPEKTTKEKDDSNPAKEVDLYEPCEIQNKAAWRFQGIMGEGCDEACVIPYESSDIDENKEFFNIIPHKKDKKKVWLCFNEANMIALSRIRVLSVWSSHVPVLASTVDPSTFQAVEWGIASIEWIISPIIRRLLDKTFHIMISIKSTNMLHNLVTHTLPRLALALEAAESNNSGAIFQAMVRGLRIALYNIEDILDMLEYIRHRAQMIRRRKYRNASDDDVGTINQGDSFKLIWTNLSLRYHKRKIKELVFEAHETIERANVSISEESYKYAPNVTVNDIQKPSTAYTTGEIIVQEKDLNRILELLYHTTDDWNPSSSVTILDIIGIIGIPWSGKTNLAQHVCMIERRQGHFDLVVWIHVSRYFRMETIFREIIEAASGMVCPQYMSLDVLVQKLEKELHGKRFLLVLDDVWCHKDVGEQNLSNLLCPLKCGRRGSKILVTSRNADALLDLSPDVRYTTIPISDLDDEAFFKLFMHYALGGARVDDAHRRKLVQIGADIVQNLKRSPLAARTVGGQLCRRQEVEFWISVRDGDVLNETMRALWSYLNLDEQVARCFAYCSIFPKRYRLHRDVLVNLWVAEGFIKTNRGEQMEAVAQGHFAELVATSCLHPGGKDHDGKDCYIIPDLLHELVQKVAGSDCFTIENGWIGVLPQDVRHLFIVSCGAALIKENRIFELQNLCTLIIFSMDYKEGVFESMFNGLQKLRVLDVGIRAGVEQDIIVVPASIGQLKHLRYFALRGSIFTLKLPHTFSKLYHMQVLDFGHVDVCFPFGDGKDMFNLFHLRHVIGNMKFIPNIGRMTSLQTLSDFLVRLEQGYKINELRNLNKLCGRLSIGGLENVRSNEEALQANLVSKELLTELEMSWDDSGIWYHREAAVDVLEGLCPPMWLERLVILNYQGLRYPNWMVSEHKGGPKHLQELGLSRWGQGGPAPDFSESFIHLRSLWLQDCSWDALPANMNHLVSLKVLSITECMNLRCLPKLPESLEELNVYDCSAELMMYAEQLHIQNGRGFTSIPNREFQQKIQE